LAREFREGLLEGLTLNVIGLTGDDSSFFRVTGEGMLGVYVVDS
jgi:hypothetical protein